MEAIIAIPESQKAALAAELGRIEAAIAALSGATAAAKTADKPPAKPGTAKKTLGRKRREMTLAERRAASVRMKKSWAKSKAKAASE